jgi:penicillin-binding protein 2
MLRNLCLCIALLLTTSACEALLSPGGGASEAPVIQLLPQTPEQVVASFLDAWGRRDYDAMYALIAPQSQQLTPPDVFRTVYSTDDAVVGLTGMTHTILATETQGSTTIVRYDLTLQSDIYDEFVDSGRMMRLIQVGDLWRIAWSRMDIFEGLAPGTLLETITERAPRGNILDRDGDFLVEENGTVTTVLVQRISMPNIVDCYTTLARVFRFDYDDLQARLDAFNADTIVPVGDLDVETYLANEGEMIDNCNIQSYDRQTRRYAGHGALAHVTGAIGQIRAEELDFWRSRGYEQDDLVGLSGVERQFEETLAGEPERVLRIREPGGAIVREITRVSGREPQDVRLTIDLDLQIAAAQAIADAFNYAAPNWAQTGRSPGGGVVILDVNTGAVLAMTSWPTYDPGIFNPDTPLFLVGEYILSLRNDARRPFFNRTIQEQYPPGSTFKIITTAAALAEGVWRADQIFTCGLRWEGRPFGDTLPERTDWRVLEENREAAGDITPAQALASSCNPFYYQMGALLYRRNPTSLMDYARRMGLGSLTGLDLTNPPEVAGQLPPIRATDEAISSAIGQSNVAVTMLQMAHMVSGVANGGDLYRPYLIEQIGDADPTTPRLDSQMGISSSVLATVREGMCEVTTDTTYGTAWFVFGDPSSGIPSTPYIPCGKTGTAQTGREPHGWFVAFAPNEDPQIAIAVMIENSREGSETAAPIVRRILDSYFEVAPELVAAYPRWWTTSYVPLPIPEGTTGG